MRFKQSDFKIINGKYRLRLDHAGLQKQCDDYLDSIKVPHFHLEHFYKVICPECNNIFSHITPGGEGLPDILIFTPQGIFMPEIKTENGRLETSQKIFFNSLPKYYKKRTPIIKSLDELIKKLKAYLK